MTVYKNSPQARRVFTSTVVTFPDSLPFTPSTSLALTPDPQPPGPSASLVEAEGTPENTEMDPDTPKPAAEGDIQNRILLLLIVQPKYSSSNKKLPIGILRSV